MGTPETGEANVSLSNMHKIARALGITLSELFRTAEKRAEGAGIPCPKESTLSGGYALPAFALMPHLVPVTVTEERAVPRLPEE